MSQTPTPPLARPTKAKSTTQKVSKLRKLSDPQVTAFAEKLNEAAAAGSFADMTISVPVWSDKLNLSVYMLERAFIRSKLGREGYDLEYDTRQKAQDNRPRVSPRFMITIGKCWVEKYNETAPSGKKYLPNQRFDVTIEEDQIILRRARPLHLAAASRGADQAPWEVPDLPKLMTLRTWFFCVTHKFYTNLA